jgi:prephenate dehydrogenase
VKDLGDCQVAIVGLGLMGGSLAGALREKCSEVTGVARRPESIEKAVARKLIDAGSIDLATGTNNADVVIIATPVRVIIRQLPEIGALIKPGCVLMDLGSTKTEVTASMNQLPGHVQPLGAHPMCGKEVGGIDAADPNLFQDNPFVFTPLPRTSEETLALGYSLAQAVGGVPLILDPRYHDKLVAAVSHLPYLLACGLMATVMSDAAADPQVWNLAASGFRDTSRLAASEVTMMLDILITNQEPVLDALSRCQAQLGSLVGLIQSGDEQALRKKLSDISTCRRELFQ